MSGDCDIEIGFDEVSKDYYIVWQPPLAVGSGNNKIEAIRDLQKAACFGVNSLIDIKLKEIAKED